MKLMSEKFVKKNIKLSMEFDEYLVKHPELFKKIPNGAYIVITIKNDPKFTEQSVSILKNTRRKKIVEAQKSGTSWTLRPFATAH